MAAIKPETQGWLDKAESSLNAAKMLLREGYISESVSRAYYAMFYAAKAMLAEDGISRNKHSGVIANFGERYARTGRITREFHKQLNTAFEERSRADYEYSWRMTEADARIRITEAEAFVQEIKSQLRI
ncbi:HEPN domain-containing protein [Candidatus Poribacteria bacterium]|nr:HEPN domain-containing protein [Candidatus Poribacteria bacterium]